MKNFANLIFELDQSSKINDKVEALIRYLKSAHEGDIIYMLGLFTGRHPKRIVSSVLMRSWAAEKAGIPMWLLEESYASVGDYSETVALLLPDGNGETSHPLSYWYKYIVNLQVKTEADRKHAVFAAWDILPVKERFVFNKLISSTFRVSVSTQLVIRAFSQHSDIPVNKLAHRIISKWDPVSTTIDDLFGNASLNDNLSKPYPFSQANQLDTAVENLGNPDEWYAEWKWEGIRVQVIVREGQIFIWNRNEELVTDKFPELAELAHILPGGTVIDGQILPFDNGRPMSFGILQNRYGRRNLTPKILKEAPVVLFAFDLLEWQGKDCRDAPFEKRQSELERLVLDLNYMPMLQLSNGLKFGSWDDLKAILQKARENSSDGLMLKHKSSVYQSGRNKGNWWKWKIDPLRMDAVLIYAMKGAGRNANLFTDYTFAVWNGDQLVSIAKANTGLKDKEIAEIDQWVNDNTVEKFGPVRTVKPELVFEIGFEGLQRSSRHKSGIALKSPVILRRRTDKTIKDADSMAALISFLELYEKGHP